MHTIFCVLYKLYLSS